MMEHTLQSAVRFIAVDIHKHYLMIGGIDAAKQIVLQPRRVDLHRWDAWARRHLRASDQVVLEATTNVWVLYDLLVTLVARVVVAHPAGVRQIAEARVKTDRVDVLTLCNLLRADLVPEVWVPPIPVRELRALLSHRRRLVSLQTTAKNRLQSVLHRLNVPAPKGKPFSQKNRAFWTQLQLSSIEHLRVEHDLATLDHLTGQLEAVEHELRQASTSAQWAEHMPYLLQVPGVGLITAMTILASVGEITRFGSAKQLVGYAGLGAGVHASGTVHRDKGITKQGRRDLRSVMVEAARAAAQSHRFWKHEFARLAARIGEQKAIVAIARKLLTVVWEVWSARCTDRRADVEQVAFKLMVWSWKLNDTQRGGLNTRQFIRRCLIQLGIGAELESLVRGGMRRRIASVEEVLALCPELHAPPDEVVLLATHQE